MADANRIIGRGFIDRNGGFQSERTGIEKAAHDAWMKANTWNLSRDDFIRLSYFHGDMDNGSDGSGPINGSEDRPGDLVYVSESGSEMSRSTASYWLGHWNAFLSGYYAAARDAGAAV